MLNTLRSSKKWDIFGDIFKYASYCDETADIKNIRNGKNLCMANDKRSH